MSFFLRQAVFIRLLVPFATGITCQWYLQLSRSVWWSSLGLAVLTLALFFTIPVYFRFRFYAIAGIATCILFIALGALVTWYHDCRNNRQHISHHLANVDAFIAVLDEPLTEKQRSWKARATIRYVVTRGSRIEVEGKILLYFRKDSLPPSLNYGSLVVFRKPLQEVQNAGNPGGFDYKRYCLFQGITHQVFLDAGEYRSLPGTTGFFQRLLYSTQDRVLQVLGKFIPGEKERGLAEALLIGYKNDLDRELVQSYSNTGVVHVIAISGLHIGLIYWLLSIILQPLSRSRFTRWLGPIAVIAGLWGFSLLAGGQPSVLRSAVMFTCIVLGKSAGRHSSIYNSLAFSAFMLLCYNPYWLWDVGFQLSYSAVLSIVVFMKPVYDLIYCRNKWLDMLWKLNAVTIAAQILTLPLTLYYFHQFPVTFLLTNIVAVPLSSGIVLGEIFLFIAALVPAAGKCTGWLLQKGIWLMNEYIALIERFPFSIWSGLQVTLLQTTCLYLATACFGYWLMEKRKAGFATGLVFLLVFICYRSISFLEAREQRKVIVYNVSQRQAIDFIDGRHCIFAGDSTLLGDPFSIAYNIRPARILYRVTPGGDRSGFRQEGVCITFFDRKILWIDSSVSFTKDTRKPSIDLLVLSKNPRLDIVHLDSSLAIRQVVLDASVPARKKLVWKRAFDSLHIPHHDVSEKGAFVMSLN